MRPEIAAPLCSAPNNNESSKIPAKTLKQSLLDWSPLLLLATFAALIFWHFPGTTCYEGDDYLQTKIYKLFDLPTNFADYRDFMRGRSFLAWSYKGLYLACGQNLDTSIATLIGVYLATSAALFAVLRRIVSAPAALIGSLLFLAHSAKYHAILAYNAQMYNVVLLCGILILAIMMSRLSPILKCIFSTALYWLSIHIYEVLMVIVPLFPIVWLTPSLLKKKLPSLNDLLCSLVPLCVTALHVHWLNSAHKPIWTRNGIELSQILQMPGALSSLFLDSTSSVFGIKHWHIVSQSVWKFFRFDLRADHTLLIPLAIAALSTTVAVIRIQRSNMKASDNVNPAVKAVLGVGLYLLLVSGLIALPISSSEVASRLLYLPTLGLALALAAGLDMIKSPPRYRVAASLLLVLCFGESIAFADVVQQNISASRLDKDLTAKIVPLEIKPGAHMYMSMPFDRRKSEYWREGLPAYYCSAYPIRLWDAANLGLDKITYCAVMRERGKLESNGLHHWLMDATSKWQARTLFPLYYDDNHRLRPITTVRIMRPNGSFERSIDTGFYGNVKDDSAISITVSSTPVPYFPF